MARKAKGSPPMPPADAHALHLAWGKQPACGKVNQPMTGEPARVTCERCRYIGRVTRGMGRTGG